MRTSLAIFMGLVVMFSVATPALADTWADAFADPSQTYDSESDSRDSEITVWEAGDYTWSCSLTAYARAVIRGIGSASQSVAWARATAEVTSPNGSDTAEAYMQIAHVYDNDDDYATFNANGSLHLEAGVVLEFDENSTASATCGNSDPKQVNARAYTTASGSVW